MQVIKDIGFDMYSKGKDIPADAILNQDLDGLDCWETWNYRSVVGKLNYIANTKKLDISMADHQ